MIKVPKPVNKNYLNLSDIYEILKLSYEMYREYDNWFELDEYTTCYKTRRLFTIIRKEPDIYLSMALSKLSDGYHFDVTGGSDIGNSRCLWKWDSPETEEEGQEPDPNMDLDRFKRTLTKQDDIYDGVMDIIDIIKRQGGIV